MMFIDVTNIYITTNRLILRPWKLTDISDFYEYASVPGVGENAGWKHHDNIETSRRILDDFIAKKEILAIVFKSNNKVIGSLGIHDIKPEFISRENGKEIGYVLSKEYWGLGLMTEAVKEVIKYLFFKTELDYLLCGHFVRNERSKRVIIKNNFKFYKEVDYKTLIGSIEKTNLYLLNKSDYLESIEKIQLFDKNLRPVDKWIYRGTEVPIDYYRGVVDIVIKNIKYNKYLLTLRDRNKETYPNCYETTGGSISYLEDCYLAAKREIKEETGIDAPYIKYMYNIIKDNVVYFEFYCETECELDSIVLQAGETSNYLWLDINEYLKMWNSDIVAASQKVRISKILEKLRN
ncbi:MAG: GNAT family N-acetyltransferase [Anaeroplasma sp.]